MPDQEEETRDHFEKFTASSAWRALPLQIKLWVVHIWRAERDPPSMPGSRPPPGKD